MPWVARAPRRWTPPPRPRLRVVKADPLNPYKGLTEAQLWQTHAGLQSLVLKPLSAKDLAEATAELVLIEQQMQAQGLIKPMTTGTVPSPFASQPSAPQPPPPLDSVAQWEKLITLAEAAAPKMQQALTDAFDWPKLPSGVQQSLVQGQVAQALAQMADFGMQQMEAAYIPAFSELTEKLFTDVANAQWPALREVLLQTEIPVELPTKLPDDIMVQRALRYVRQEGLTRAKNLWAPTIEASREVIRVGLAEGKTTPQIARELRQHIGLLPGQVTQLHAYTSGLAESGTPQAKMETLSEKFAAKLLRRRTTVIARTETIAALNVAADTFFEAAKDAANLPETALRRFWLITYTDTKTCPICRAIPPANEQGKLFNEPFLTSKGPLLRPPAHPQCRCVVIVRPTIIATPGLATPPMAPAPPVLPPPVPFPPPLPTPPPKVKKPAKPKKPKAPPAPPPPAMSEQYTDGSLSPPWSTYPKYKFWEQIEDVDLGTLPTPPPGKLSTGVVMIEDGKVWVYEPKNHFGGYTTAFPKGTTEPHLTHQQNAIKEVFEETGLQAKITGFLGDFTATTGTTRLYLGHKFGGNPTGFGDETWSVKLLTPADLEKEFVAQGKSYPLQALQALKDKGLIPAVPGVPGPPPAAVLPPLTQPPPLPTVTPTPAPAKAPKAKPLKASDKIEEDTAKGELLRDLGGSTGAKQWQGTDGVVRAVKGPKTQQAYQEFVANKLYKELGIDAPEQKLTMQGGKITGVASDWIEGQTLEKVGVTQDRARGILKGFVADVWLGNRDALGLTMDNILVQGNRVIRIDNGGALMFRAQGTLKPKEWTEQIGEWQGLQDTTKNRHYAGLFQAAGYGNAQGIPDLLDQVKALQALRDRTNGFADLVPAAPGITAKQRKDLVTLLQKRATLLEEQVGLKAPAPTVDVAAETAKLKRFLGYSYDSHAQALQRRTVPADMHEYEAVGIYDYTASGYKQTNPPFWSIRDAAWRASERERVAPLIDAVNSGLKKLPASKAGTIYYRGVDFISATHMAEHTKGNIITLEGFASTSLNRKTAENFGGREYMYIIKSRGGSHDVRQLSAMGVGSSEAEFLYPPDTKFRIVDIYKDPKGVIRHPVYEIEEIPDVDLEKRRALDKAAGPQDPEAQGDQWPAGWETWSFDKRQAWVVELFTQDLGYVPTEHERLEARHLADKMASASGHNQVDPNAD